MEVMQIRSVPGSSLHLVGDITDLDSRSHEVQVEFPHERVDSFRTTFGPDCFRESFDTLLPIMCWAHDLRDPIGRALKAQVLRSHNEVIGRFSDIEAVPSAKRAFSQIDDGTITDFSFGYVNGPERPHPDVQLRRRGVRQIPKATMREFSPVSIGSIPGAKVAGIREDGNLVTVESPEQVAKLVELKVISPEEGNQLLRSFGLLDGVRDGGPGSIGAPSGVAWSVADAVSHLAEVHGVDAYKMGLAQMTPQTLAIIHQQVGAGYHDHGPFTGWLAAIASSLDYALQNGTLLDRPWVAQEDKVGQVGDLGYSVRPGVGGLSGMGRPGDASKAIPPGAVGAAGAAGYAVGGRAAVADAAMFAHLAHQAAGDAQVAAAAGDGATAHLKARQARQHARMARECGTRGVDDQAVLAADEAAHTASAVADRFEGGDGVEPLLRADEVVELVERVDPAMGLKLRQAQLALAPADVEILFRDAEGDITDGAGESVELPPGDAAAGPELVELAQNVEAALDNARQWLEGADLSSMPDEVQQALALVSAAADGSDALLEVLGGTRASDGDGDEDGDFSDTPWEQFSESDYTPEQYKAAALIDTGSGEEGSKDRYALPVKEPSGKVNKHGVVAAAGRINQVKAPDEAKRKAARQLMSMYGKMKKPCPPNVLKILGQGQRADQDELEDAQKLLEERLAARPAARPPAKR